jgi:hypothetical protein
LDPAVSLKILEKHNVFPCPETQFSEGIHEEK